MNPEGQAESSDAAGSRSVETPPALLAMMEEHRTAEREADQARRSLPTALVDNIAMRSRSLGIKLSMRDGGQIMELIAPIPR